MENDKRQKALQLLLDKANSQGYVTFDDILDCADSFSLPLQDFDWLSNSITSRGIIVYDGVPSTSLSNNTEEYDDFSQIDYEEIYKKVLKIEPNLSSFIDSIRNIMPPQTHEVDQLKYLVQEGNTHARQRMIEMNLRQAVRIALKRVEQYGTDMESTLSDACVGLVNAIDKYDPDSSGPLVSYLSLWVVQNISREQPTQNPLVYFPVHKKEEYYAAYPVLKQRGCIQCEEFSSCHSVREILSSISCVTNIDDIIMASTPCVSFEGLVDQYLEQYGDDYIDYLEPILFGKDLIQESVDLEKMVRNKQLSESIKKVLETLTPREATVLSLRYGLMDGTEKTLEEVGNLLGVTRERIRQIEAKAIRKLRHSQRAKYLKDLL